MTPQQITYLVFGIVLLLALVFDLGLLSKKSTTISIKKALWQTAFWVSLAMAFFVFLFFENGKTVAFEYLSAYLMEWSLSIDNIFVFILIFSFFGIQSNQVARALLIGIMMAIVLRILFITVGIELVERFHGLLYAFGALLLYTGYKMFTAKEDEEKSLEENRVYKFLRRFFRLTAEDTSGKFVVIIEGKRHYTSMFVVIVMLATTDVIFAVDSIPAVFGISKDPLVVYTSNIFAVLGLRSLFFLLKGAVNKFKHLQHGIAIVLIFIGLKMLLEHWINQWLSKNTQVVVSLMVILVSVAASIVYSMQVASREEKSNTQKDSTDLS